MTVLIHRHFLVLYNCGWREMQLFQIGANVAYQKKAMEKEKKKNKKKSRCCLHRLSYPRCQKKEKLGSSLWKGHCALAEIRK